MITLMAAIFGCGLLLVFYSIASIVAFKSAMIFLILAGAAAIAIGAGLGLIVGYAKYTAFFNKQIGKECVDGSKNQEKTVVTDGKKSFKQYVTLPNVTIAVLALGALFTIISAGLGCINRDKWVEATTPFMNESGFYANVERKNIKKPLFAETSEQEDISRIEIDFREKEAVIIYTDDTDMVISGYATIEFYSKYTNQLSVYRFGNGTLKLAEATPPKTDDTAIKKIFFFMFKDFDVEKQVKIYLPKNTRQGESKQIEIVGERVIFAAEQENAEANEQ